LTALRKISLAALLALLAGCATRQEAPPVVDTPEPVVSAAPAKKPAAKPAATGLLDATKLPPFQGERQVVKEPLRGVTTVDVTAPAEDLWERIRRGFAMPDLDNKLVRRKSAEYAASPEYLQRILDRSRLYLYHIVEEIEKRGLPTELALLPMVESAFNPMAYSRAHASGLWQFVPGTGKRYELAQNWWYDGRRDIVDSTNAALDYLTYIYEMHGDWHLTLASYNWGENAVRRAIAKNRKAGKPSNYANLKMPRETQHYIPKLQALKNIIADPEPYGIDLGPVPNEPYFVTITDHPEIDVQLAAKLAEMKVEEFIALNPGFSRPLIRSSATSRIVLPADKVAVFHENLANHDQNQLVSWRVYHPKAGETLGGIAKQHRLSIEQLKRVNGIAAHSWAIPRVMLVPLKGVDTAAVGKLPIMFAAPVRNRGAVRGVHVVRKGDTLSSIAGRYKVTVADLKRWNELGRFLQVGQKVYIRKTVRQ
jgi:membrane-bound lytic murein transglycosylase D